MSASVLSKLFAGCADVLERIEGRAYDLLDESNPAKIHELVAEYEEELGLESTGTTEEREARVLAQAIARQRYRPIDFQNGLAALFGLSASNIPVIETLTSSTKLTKTGGAGATWDAGAASNEKIAGDGFVESIAGETDKIRAFGLSSTDANVSYVSIQYAWLFDSAGSLVYVYESSVLKYTGGYISGDVFRVHRIGTTVFYTQNGIVRYTSATPTSAALLADLSAFDTNATLQKVRLFAIYQGAPEAITLTWQNVTNVTVVNDYTGDVREIFRFFVYRNPALGGIWYIVSAQQFINRIKPSHTLGFAIESVSMICDDPYSICDRDILGD